MKAIFDQPIFSVRTVIAHRGASAYAPENTLAAMRKAKALGAIWVEFDVQLTKENELVVFHDSDVRRTTNGMGLLRGLTLAEWGALDAGSWFHDDFQDEKIPTFKGLITLLGELGLRANVELKPALPADEKIIAQMTVELIKKHWPSDLPLPLISSFSWESLRVVRELSSDLPIALLMWHWSDVWEDVADAIDAVSVHARDHLLTEHRIVAIQATGRQVLSYTVDDPLRARELFSRGIDGIFSNYPDILEFSG